MVAVARPGRMRGGDRGPVRRGGEGERQNSVAEAVAESRPSLPGQVKEDEHGEEGAKEAEVSGARVFEYGSRMPVAGDHEVGDGESEGTTDNEEEDADVPLSFVLDFVEQRVNKRTLYSDLFVYIPFVIMFSFFAYGDRVIDESFYSSKVAREVLLGAEIETFEFTRTFEDVLELEGWQDWMRGIFIPEIFPETPPLNGTTSLWGGENYLLGAVRIRTLRVTNSSCSIDASLFDPTHSLKPDAVEPCFGRVGEGEETRLLYRIPNPLVPKSDKNVSDGPESPSQQRWLYNHFACSDIPGGQYVIGTTDVYHCGGYVVDVPFTRTSGDVERLLDVFEDPKHLFVDKVATRFISTEFFTYHPMSNSFTSVKLFVEQTPGGTFIPQYQLRSFMVWTQAESQFQTIYDFVFFVFVLYYLYRFVRDWVLFYRTKKLFIAFLFSVWNCLELVNLCVFMATFALRWVWWDVSKQSKYTTFPYAPRYPEDLDRLLTLWSTSVYLNVTNCVMVFLKILKYLRLNPRLGILTMAISVKKSQLLGVLGLFVWCVFTFALAGYGLYGTTMWEFHTIAQGFTTLLRFLLGDFSAYQKEEGIYTGMRQENRILSGFFFWCYVVLVFFILLNMVIAVLSEGFSVANARAGQTTLADDIKNAIKGLLQMFKPSRLRAALALACSGSSVDECLVLAVVNISQHREITKGEHKDMDDDAILMDRKALGAYVGAEISSKLGEVYLDDMWAEIQRDYKDMSLTQEV